MALDFSPAFIGNQHLQGNIYVGIPSARNKGKLTSKTLVHRALVVCSKTKLGSELDKIKQLLTENGYPENVITACLKEKLANFTSEKPFGPEKCPVFLAIYTLDRKCFI